MNPTAATPDRGEITETTDADGVTLGWPAYKAGANLSTTRGFCGLWLCGWAVGEFFAARALVTGQAAPLLFIWFLLWTVGGIAGAVALWNFVRPPTPESVRLEADQLKYDPGRGPSESRSCAELPSGKVVPVKPAAATEVPRAAIRGFGVDRVNERQRLYLDTDDRRVEIGGCLTESERAWLFEALQRWLGAPHAPAPWARHHKEART